MYAVTSKVKLGLNLKICHVMNFVEKAHVQRYAPDLPVSDSLEPVL